MTRIPVSLLLVMYSDVIISCAHAQGTMDDLLRLRDTLFQNYTMYFRPVYNLSDPIHVTFDMYLISILDLDEVTGTITLNCVVKISWSDYRLSWNPSNFGDITSFVFNASNVWKPRIYIATSSEDLSDFSYDAYDVRVYSNGSVTSSPSRHVKASCSFDMTNFPKDSQTCSLQIASWAFLASEMLFLIARSEIGMTSYKPNGEWDIDWTSVTDNTYVVPMLDFSMHLTRRSAYFTVSLIIPVLLLCFLNPFVFLLPASSGERISYTITMFLSLAVYMTLIGENIPKVSDPMAGISYFLLLVMFYSCLLILLTIFTLRCEAVTDIRMFPGWFLRIVFRLGFHKSVINTNKVDAAHTVINAQVMGNDKATEWTINSGDEEVQKTVRKEDVMLFIDKSLFYLTFVMIVFICLGFGVYFWL
ncbi:Neuronal acetylcholine receptor subunit alpha-6 [Mizuhopecten yessoensis]|uniref:Neuronal acetylcholine receptor subunit alpha-6 n=1 Tax=Mizuhopecten yessoensis TaxID=6573 RepID=A0A210QF17_MIZYE|nr:Neuronal acetylcholine receptor subunit alpha-6 [Mizuhopecten yessoensis]OWF47340.1 Neuronal acetylcholine receptor subunit alpha-6 [Mizuhopecten yessoensis]